MHDLKVQIRDYFDAVSQPTTIKDLVSERDRGAFRPNVDSAPPPALKPRAGRRLVVAFVAAAFALLFGLTALLSNPISEDGTPVAIAGAATTTTAGPGPTTTIQSDLTESDSPATATLTEPVSPGVWSRVPPDEAVFGGEGDQRIVSVTTGGPGLVAVGSDGGLGPWVSGSDTDAAVWISPDGFTWSRVAHDEAVFGGEDGQVMSAVIAGGPGLVAVGWDGQGILADSPELDAAIWTSVDGYTWSRVPHEDAVFGGAWIEAVTVGGPGLVAVGGTGGYSVAGDAAVWTSVDGITWSRVPHDESVFGGDDGQFISDVTVGGPGLVAVGSDGGIGPWDHNTGTHAAVWTSVDGTTWSRVPDNDALVGTGGPPVPMLGVAAGGPGLVAVGSAIPVDPEAGTPVWTSPDGLTWTRVPDDETLSGAMLDVVAGGPGLVAVGCVCRSGGWMPVVWTSVDGITWTPIPVLRSIDHMSAVNIQGPYIVVVGSAAPQGDAVVRVTRLED